MAHLAAAARRYGASRRHRPLGQHGLGHALGRLAAILADHPGAGLLPELARRRCSGWSRACPRRLAPGKRPRTTLSPVAGLRTRAAGASPSARPAATSRTSGSCSFFLRHVHHGMDLQQAIDAPLFHTTHFAGLVLPALAGAGRRRRGIEPARGDADSFGSCGPRRDAGSGRQRRAADRGGARCVRRCDGRRNDAHAPWQGGRSCRGIASAD